MEFKPNIVGFGCNWCTYMGADLTGSLRCEYPAFILEALRRGADGVFVGGCHPGDCHYQEGNYKASRRAKLLKKMLPELGFKPERFRLEWISAAESAKFAEVMKEFTEQVKNVGPNPLKGGI